MDYAGSKALAKQGQGQDKREEGKKGKEGGKEGERDKGRNYPKFDDQRNPEQSYFVQYTCVFVLYVLLVYHFCFA